MGAQTGYLDMARIQAQINAPPKITMPQGSGSNRQELAQKVRLDIRERPPMPQQISSMSS